MNSLQSDRNSEFYLHLNSYCHFPLLETISRRGCLSRSNESCNNQSARRGPYKLFQVPNLELISSSLAIVTWLLGDTVRSNAAFSVHLQPSTCTSLIVLSYVKMRFTFCFSVTNVYKFCNQLDSLTSLNLTSRLGQSHLVIFDLPFSQPLHFQSRDSIKYKLE